MKQLTAFPSHKAKTLLIGVTRRALEGYSRVTGAFDSEGNKELQRIPVLQFLLFHFVFRIFLFNLDTLVLSYPSVVVSDWFGWVAFWF